MILTLLAAAGCSGPSGAAVAPNTRGETLAVVATTTVLQDLARVVGGDDVAVTGILRAGVDPHDFEPAPADLRSIGSAAVLLENGLGLESWLDDTIRSAGFSGVRTDTSTGVPIRPGDPHIWHDPANAKVMVGNVVATFASADPEHAEGYRQRGAAYAGRLDALDTWVRSELGALSSRKLVTNHDSLGYYAEAFDLDVVGAVVPSFDTSAELSGKEVDDLVVKIRATGARAIFSEATIPGDAARTVAEEAGVTVVAGEDSLYTDGLGPSDSPAATYVAMVEHNTRVIEEALR